MGTIDFERDRRGQYFIIGGGPFLPVSSQTATEAPKKKEREREKDLGKQKEEKKTAGE
jgi:hypothetical protein